MAGVLKAAKTNDARATLIAMRDTIAAGMDNTTSARDIAQLSRRLMEVMAELDALPDPDADDPVQAAQRLVANYERD